MNRNRKDLVLYIIILNWNGLKCTVACLKSLRRVRVKNVKINIVIVDNNSTKDNSKNILPKKKGILYVQNNDDLGYTGGNNVGIRIALKNKADCILLLNNDTVVTPNFLEPLTKILYSKNNIGIVGPKIYFDNKNTKIIANAGGIIRSKRYFGEDRGCGEKDLGQYDKTTPVDFITGAATLIKSEVFKTIGLLDERYFLYYEDTDFGFKARKAGFLAVFVPQSYIFHAVSSSIQQGSSTHHYYTTRNHLLFIENQAPLYIKLRESIRNIKTIWELLFEKDSVKKKYSLLGIRDYYLRRFGNRII